MEDERSGNTNKTLTRASMPQPVAWMERSVIRGGIVWFLSPSTRQQSPSGAFNPPPAHTVTCIVIAPMLQRGNAAGTRQRPSRKWHTWKWMPSFSLSQNRVGANNVKPELFSCGDEQIETLERGNNHYIWCHRALGARRAPLRNYPNFHDKRGGLEADPAAEHTRTLGRGNNQRFPAFSIPFRR